MKKGGNTSVSRQRNAETDDTINFKNTNMNNSHHNTLQNGKYSNTWKFMKTSLPEQKRRRTRHTYTHMDVVQYELRGTEQIMSCSRRGVLGVSKMTRMT